MRIVKFFKGIFLLCALLAYIYTVNASGCGGNNPCGTDSNYVDISNWCSQYDGWSMDCCSCIASHESGGDANACNLNTNGSYDIGVWQINDSNWSSCSGGNAPCDPNDNLQCAIDVFNWGGQTWKFWATCSQCGCCDSS